MCIQPQGKTSDALNLTTYEAPDSSQPGLTTRNNLFVHDAAERFAIVGR